MRIAPVTNIITHSDIHKTLFFEEFFDARPGQFVMIWIPGIDEIPMSLSHIGKTSAITVERLGEATTALYIAKMGDLIGLRGPYGNGFTIKGDRALFVAGGTGIAPLLPLISSYPGKSQVVLGAKTANYLLFENDIKKITKIHITTDDGTKGFKGLATELAEKTIKNSPLDIVYACGPELMIKKLLDICETYEIPLQASIERYMKCGVGICDSCALNGYHVCKDGPVFSDDILRRMSDFSRWKRNESGRRIKL